MYLRGGAKQAARETEGERERVDGDRYGEAKSVIQLANELSFRPTIQPVAKKLVAATGAVDYNILQNNGRIAHQIVDHVSLAFSLHSLFILLPP